MRLPPCALFLLMSSRLFATSTATASVNCGSSPLTNTGEVSVQASCMGPPGLAIASTSIGSASPFSTAAFPGYTASVTAITAHATATLDIDLSMLITGGTGPGTWSAVFVDRLMVDPVDTGYYLTNFGPAQHYMDSSGLQSGNAIGSFTYGVPQILHLSLLAVVRLDTLSVRSGTAASSLAGVQVVDAQYQVVTGPVISISEVPEPSFSVAIGLSWLALAAWRIKPKTRLL